ncbi:MAG: helix-turn-helix domain-containing protein [Candidatus Pacearchaeota archaeon]|jgi:sugar-specific transcriptional regulator TrmB
MIVKPDLVNKIKDYFGLNIYETKVWLALLNKGIASAGEIAELSGVPRSRTYDVLESLEKNGFAMQKIGKPVKYFAIKPIAVIEKLKKNTMDEMNEKVAMLSNIKDTKEYKELELLHSTKTEMIKKQDLSGTIRGRTNINSQISDIINLAKEEVIICASTNEVKRRLKLLEPIVKQVSSANVKITLALNGPEPDIKLIGERLNLRAKKIDINASFYIADKKEILFMLNEANDSQEQLAVWFSSEFFVNSFTALFDMAIKKITK